MWLSKLLGYDYEIVYKKGKENVAADALSRVQGPELLTLTLLSVSTDLVERVKKSWEAYASCVQLIKQLQSDDKPSRFTFMEGLLKRKGKLVVGFDEDMRNDIVILYHSSSVGGILELR